MQALFSVSQSKGGHILNNYICVGTYYVTKLGVHRHYAHFFLKVPTVAVRAAIPVAMELAEMILQNLLVNLYLVT